MERKLVQLLQNCKNSKQLKQTHVHVITNGLQGSTFIVPKLITLSSDLISLDHSINVLQSSNSCDVVSYNTLIKCFKGKNTHLQALHIYNHMRACSVLPNSFTFTFLLSCFDSAEDFRDGCSVRAQVVRFGFDSSVFVQNSILGFYSRCGEGLGLVRRVFDEIPERDVVSWNTMIGCYMANGDVEYAIGLFEEMPERSTATLNSVIGGLSRAGNMEMARSIFERMPERDEVSWNTMISGYVRARDVETALSIFDRMPQKTTVSWTAMVTGYTTIGDHESAKRIFDETPVKNVISWNAMIACYVHNHVFDEALSLFHHMLIDGQFKPDSMTLVSVLSACAHLGSLEHGKWIHWYIKQIRLVLSNPLGNALIDMYAKCGDVKNARNVFDRMGKRCIITWTTMISGLAVHGQCREALALFDRMRMAGFKPDDVIFISVLSACTHGGLVEEGKRVFDQMVNDYRIIPRIEHYGCMVDMLGRAGKLDEAIRFIEKMHIEPNAVIWATLLGACKVHGNRSLLELVTMKILDQEPLNPNYLTMITNLSSSVGKWEDALSFRTMMRKPGTEKVPGCSLIQIGNTVHEFLAKDVRHEERKEIYGVLSNLNGQLKAVSDMQLRL